MLSFNDFIHKSILKNKATNNMKIYKVLKKLGLDSKLGIYLRDDNFSSKYGILNLHTSRGTQWVCYIKDCYFDSYGCPAPKQLPKYF